MNLPPQLQAHWSRLAPREKTGLLMAAGLVSLALLWWVLLGPALQTWRTAEVRQRSLDGQLQTMQALQAQAQALQAQPRLGYDETRRLLEASVKQQLGSAAQLSVSAEHATVTLKGVSGEALALWLTQTRINAHVLPSEARLTRSAPASASWDGTVVLALPAR
jgi:general secretion pathway protein M